MRVEPENLRTIVCTRLEVASGQIATATAVTVPALTLPPAKSVLYALLRNTTVWYEVRVHDKNQSQNLFRAMKKRKLHLRNKCKLFRA